MSLNTSLVTAPRLWTRMPVGLHLSCPHCHKPVVIVEHDKVMAYGQDYWLHGGDCLSEVYEHLIVNGDLPPLNWSASSWFGECLHCSKRYFATDALIRKQPESEKWWERFLAKGSDGPTKTWLIHCEHPSFVVPRSWIMTRQETEHGYMDTHTFGPYRSSDDRKAALMFRELKELLSELAGSEVLEGTFIPQEDQP